jgi:hypothetical protein
MMRQLAVVAASVLGGAVAVMTIGFLTMPEPPPPFVAADADPDLPSPEDLNQAGAVVFPRGSPVDDGVIEERYELEGTGTTGGFMLSDPPPDGHGEFRFGRAPRTLLLRWTWVDGEEGGEIADVRATLSLPGATFFGRDAECDLSLDVYEPYEVVQEMEELAHTRIIHWMDAAGTLTCQNLVAVGMDEPISYQAVFRIPDRALYQTFG